jgi:hypothetical protein
VEFPPIGFEDLGKTVDNFVISEGRGDQEIKGAYASLISEMGIDSENVTMKDIYKKRTNDMLDKRS